MKSKPISGRQMVTCSDISGSTFATVNLSGAQFDDVNLSGTRIHNANLSDMRISAAQIGGTKFKHIGLPPDANGKEKRQKGIVFEEGTLCDSVFRKVDLSGVKIVNCNLEGMTIDGV